MQSSISSNFSCASARYDALLPRINERFRHLLSIEQMRSFQGDSRLSERNMLVSNRMLLCSIDQVDLVPFYIYNLAEICSVWGACGSCDAHVDCTEIGPMVQEFKSLHRYSMLEVRPVWSMKHPQTTACANRLLLGFYAKYGKENGKRLFGLHPTRLSLQHCITYRYGQEHLASHAWRC